MADERTETGLEVEAALGEVLAHVRGETALPCRIIALRKRMKLNRQKFADRFGLDARAIQDQEQGCRVPDRAPPPVRIRHICRLKARDRHGPDAGPDDRRDRPQLAAALDFARAGDTLVVWRLDRLARSLRQLIETVEDVESRGIGLRSLTEALDTTTSGGRLVFHVFGALAEFERAIIRERTRAGLDSARVRGRLGGRPPRLDVRSKAIAAALLKDPFIPVAEIARQLGVSRTTLYKHFPGGRAAAE